MLSMTLKAFVTPTTHETVSGNADPSERDGNGGPQGDQLDLEPVPVHDDGRDALDNQLGRGSKSPKVIEQAGGKEHRPAEQDARKELHPVRR